jgi:ribosomal protein S18 acetylase RimI-like enzyme
MKNDKIREVIHSDLDSLKIVLDSCGLFPSEYLDDMISDYFHNLDTNEIWFTYVENDSPISIGYCIPEKLTSGTYNLLAIGVSENHQRKGVAVEMMNFIEQKLKTIGARVLIVETSSDDAQIGARNLYQKLGYNQEAVIRDFWNEGEDKIVYWKKL